jgi:superfamily II DNA helicase RecQ
MSEVLKNIASALQSLSVADKAKLFDSILVILAASTPRPDNTTEKLSHDVPSRSTEPRKVTKTTGIKLNYVNQDKLSPDDTLLFDQLRAWRNKVAKDLEIQAFMVFDNKTISSIAHYRPQTPEDLERIKGIGKDKSEKYSEDILAIVLKGSHTSVSKPPTAPKRYMK